jgi:hypothetical protein
MGEASRVASAMIKKISAGTLGAVLATLLMPAAVTGADTTDDEFVLYLESHGIHLGTPA